LQRNKKAAGQGQLTSDLGRGQLTSTRPRSKQPRAALTQPAALGRHCKLSSVKPPSVLAISCDSRQGRLWIRLSEGTEARHGNGREDDRRGKGPAKSLQELTESKQGVEPEADGRRGGSRWRVGRQGGTREAHRKRIGEVDSGREMNRGRKMNSFFNQTQL
jgi:hypothetical protein